MGKVDAFSVRDLRERTGELLRNAERGSLSLVTKYGRPAFLAVPFDERLLDLGVQRALAVKLYQEEVVTLSQAAKVAGELEELLRRRPGDRKLSLDLSELYLETEKVEPAYDILFDLYQQTPDDEAVWSRLAEIAGWTGRPDDENRAMRLRLAHHPEDRAAAQRLAGAGHSDQSPEKEADRPGPQTTAWPCLYPQRTASPALCARPSSPPFRQRRELERPYSMTVYAGLWLSARLEPGLVR